MVNEQDRGLLIGIGSFLAVAWVLAIVLATRSDRTKAQEEARESFSRMQEFVDDMCKCDDKRCAERVSEDMTKWARDKASSKYDRDKTSEADTKKMAALSEELSRCMVKAMTRDSQ